MTTEQAVQKLTDVIRRKHLALNTEHSYRAWLKRYCDFVPQLPAGLSSEQKLERFLTALAKDDVSASTQNQAFNAIIFFYQAALGVELKNIQALRARRPKQVRRAPTREETLRLIQTVVAGKDFVASLVVRLLYGCGLRGWTSGRRGIHCGIRLPRICWRVGRTSAACRICWAIGR